MQLQPFLELGKQITDSSLCGINIHDKKYRSILLSGETGYKAISSGAAMDEESTPEYGYCEIEDLSADSRYKDHHYVSGVPYLRHFFSIKLTTYYGKDVGTLSVAGSKAKRLTRDQKVQFKLLSHAVMAAIEGEYNLQKSFLESDAMKVKLQRLNHDVRSPINGITGLADLLIEESDEEAVRISDIVMIKESALSIIDIITGVLEKTKTIPSSQKTLSYVLEKTRGLYSPLAQNKDVSFTLSNQSEKVAGLPYDFSNALLRVIGNLVSNAIKFTPEGGSVDVIFDEVRESKSVQLKIVVKDTGSGMSMDQIRSFNSGEPVSRSGGQSGEKSFGLGLQHVHQMVSEMQGSVTIEGDKGSGNSFTVVLPVPERAGSGNDPEPSVNVEYSKPSENGESKVRNVVD